MLQFHLMHKDAFKHGTQRRGQRGGGEKARQGGWGGAEETMRKGGEIRQIVKQRVSDIKQ